MVLNLQYSTLKGRDTCPEVKSAHSFMGSVEVDRQECRRVGTAESQSSKEGSQAPDLEFEGV